jgi:hypothetical protein
MPIPERNLMLRMPNQPPTRKTTTVSKPDKQPATALWRNTQYQRQLHKAKEEEERINEALYNIRLVEWQRLLHKAKEEEERIN